MAFLLDTHALLWALTEPAQLGAVARDLITDSGSHLIVSAASAWEIATKYRLGKLPGAEGVVRGYQQHLARLGATPLEITTEHALLAGGISWQHRDPFDRVVAAQCLVDGLPLISRDSAFADVPGLTLIW